MAEWFEKQEAEILDELETGMKGLSQTEAEKRLEKYGENRLREQGHLPWWQVFLAQFKDLLVVILIGAAAVSMMTKDARSAMVIFTVLLLNACLGTIQHERAEKTLDSLRRLSSPEARVLRGGKVRSVPSTQVVLGDILLLEAGDMAAADGRLLEGNHLAVNESSLTGESMAVEKDPGRIRKEAPLAERTNMIFSGSLITGGRGKMVVTATGMDTEIGKIAALMDRTKEKKTPLQVSLDHFSGHLAMGVMAVCGLVFLLSLYRREPVLDALMFAVALAVAAIPEALSSIVTIVQAMGTQKMAKEQAIIKDLKAVESLGCVSVICSDKTGTLTQNRMSVEKVYINQREQEPDWLRGKENRQDVKLFLLAAALNNHASEGEGDPVEKALFHMVQESGLSPHQIRAIYPRKWEIPFDSSRKRMTTVHHGPEGEIMFVKGAVDVLLEHCSRVVNPGNRAEEGGREADSGNRAEIDGIVADSGNRAEIDGIAEDRFSRALSSSDRRLLLEQNRRWSQEGLRVLAFACGIPKDLGEEGEGLREGREQGLIFLGMAAMMDPPRPESRPAVAKAWQAGICPVMITGDHPVTALSVARQIGICSQEGRAVTGTELDQMTEQELGQRLEQISVYARVSPEHKLRIVEAWQKKGHIVAMTGDGVNDAPALKKADIGVAMGITGTQVSKDAASMILADDNFATIIKAVANGRNVYRNIKNSIQFLLSGNMAGIFCVLYTSLRALPLPFQPVHLLFINLLTDSLPAIAIGMEPPEEGLLEQPPRNPREGILTLPFVRDILIQGGLIAAASMWAYRIGLSAGGEASACTMAFSTLTLARLFHGFNCRSHKSLLRLGLGNNPYSILAFALGAALLGAVLFIPSLQVMFAASDLTVSQVTALAAAAFFPTLMIQMYRMVREMIL